MKRSIFILLLLFGNTLCLYSQYSHIDLSYIPIDHHDSISFSDTLFNAGMREYLNEDFTSAINIFERCYEIDKELNTWYSMFPKAYVLIGSAFLHNDDYSRLWLACSYYRVGNEIKAQDLDNNYMIEPFDRKKVAIADSIYNHALLLPDSKNIEYFQAVCDLDSINLGTQNYRYAYSLYRLGEAHSKLRQFQDAKRQFLHAYDIIYKLYGERNWIYSSVLSKLAYIAYHENDIVTAIHYLEQALIKDKDINAISYTSLMSPYSTLVSYYTQIGEWDKAIQIEWQRVKYWRDYTNRDMFDESDYSTAISTYCHYLSEAGKYKQALRVYKELYRNREKKYWDHSQYEDLADLYYNLSSYDKALNNTKTFTNQLYGKSIR